MNPDGSKINLWTSSDVNFYHNAEIDVDQFIVDLKNYVMDANDKLFASKNMIFTIEMQTFRTHTEPSRNVSVVVSI